MIVEKFAVRCQAGTAKNRDLGIATPVREFDEVLQALFATAEQGWCRRILCRSDLTEKKYADPKTGLTRSDC